MKLWLFSRLLFAVAISNWDCSCHVLHANSDIVFNIVFDSTNEVYYGRWLRNIHSNGASFFLSAVYFHTARSIYYSSFLYPRQLV
jgi:quinol-cytochrome oxidoreductase complex cytochrome b subunit